MHHEDRTHRIAVALGIGFLAAHDGRIARHALHLRHQGSHFLLAEHVLQQNEAVAVVRADLRFAQSIGKVTVALHHRVLAGDDRRPPVSA